MKEQSYLQQINVYQEEVSELQNRLAKEKQRHEESYLEAKEVVDSMKASIEADKSLINDLEARN